MDYVALKNYIQTDPDNLGLAPLIAAGNDGAIAALGNAPGKTKAREIGSYLPYRYLVKRMLWRPIAAAAADPAHPAHAAATVAVDLIAPGGDMPVNLADPDAAPMFAALVAAGLLSAANRGDLIAMCTVPCSYFEARGFAGASELDVRKILWNDNGTRAI